MGAGVVRDYIAVSQAPQSDEFPGAGCGHGAVPRANRGALTTTHGGVSLSRIHRKVSPTVGIINNAINKVGTMKKSLILFAAAMLFTAYQVRAEDIAEGTILAFDRKANVLVFTDKSIWPLEKLQGSMPDDLQAGDRIEVRFDSNEDDGVTAIHLIKRLQ